MTYKPLTLFTCWIFLSLYCFSQAPANDECSGAILLTVNNDPYTGTQEGATQSAAPCINTGNDAKDVWYKFVATSDVHRITVNPLTYRDKIFQVYSGDCGNLTSLACVNSAGLGQQDVALVNGLNAGSTYYIRVYDVYANTPQSEFTIRVDTSRTLISNDECTGAININVDPVGQPNLQQRYSTLGATQSMPGCYGTAEDDVWFKFTATGKRQKIWVTVADTYYNPVVEVFDGQCGSLVSKGCYYTVDVNPASLDVDLLGLTPGTSYYYRVYGKTSNNVRSDISTAVVSMPNTPANDECSGAVSLTVNSDPYTGTQDDATQSTPPCANTGYEAKDVWFKFTATSDVHRVTVNPLTYRDKIFQVYSGDCNNLTSLACVNASGLGEQEIALVNGLTTGNTYYIRVYDVYGNNSQSEFTIRVDTSRTLIPNDECAGAIKINLDPQDQPNLQQRYSNLGSTQSMPGCYGTAEDDIWFKFTAAATRHRIWVTVVNTSFNPVVEVFEGQCGSLVSKGCHYTVDPDPASLNVDLTGLTPGTTYYYRVYGKAADNAKGDISTAVVGMVSAPANDECSGAISLTVSHDPTQTYTGTQEGAGQSLPPCVNTGYEAKDVWFKFTAASGAHRITVKPLAYRDKIFQVYSGPCDSPTSLACVNTGDMMEPDTVLLNSLIAGATYYIRVYDKYANTSQSEFTIGIYTPQPDVPTAVNDIELDKTTGVYPNPYISGDLVIKISDVLINKASVVIYDLYGQKVLQENIHQQITQLHPAHLTKGLYLVKITVGERTVTKRFIQL